MINRTTILVLCFALLLFDSTSRTRAENVSETAFRTFDVVAIQALALFLEAPTWESKLTHPPSKGFVELLRTRPQTLLFAVDKWFFSAANATDTTQPVEVDLKQYPVETSDINVALEILKEEYISRYISCMRDAFLGKGKGDCIKILSDLAEKVGKEMKNSTLTQFLRADLGARLLALSSNNSEWNHLLTSRETPEVDLVLRSNTELEMQKAFAVWSGKPVFIKGLTPVNFQPVKVLDSETAWLDFGTAVPSTGTTVFTRGKFPTYAWKVENGKANLTSLSKNPDVYTIFLDSTRSLMIKGSLTEEDLVTLYGTKSWTDLLSTANEKNWKAYLSRPGSGTLGELQVAYGGK
jgi:hypothetical protein